MARNSVRADTPDPTKYHEMKGVVPGVMIPRAGNDGQSLGFDANKSRVVVVDPGEEGGGFSVDMALVAKSKNVFNSAAKRVSDVSAFYKELSKRMLKEEESIPVKLPESKKGIMMDTIKPLTSLPPITPGTIDENHVKITNQVNMELQEEAKLAADQFRKVQTANNVVEHNMLHSQVLQQTQTINLLIEKMNQLAGSIQPPKVAEPEIKDMLPKENDKLESTLESFQIPFFKGKPERPQFETYFEMSKLGTMAAKYHAVVVGDACLALVYDTRFEDGFQYLPPNLGEEQIKVSVPKLKTEFKCSSLGLHWSLGCLDIVILIRHEE
jgi:hypothetical protein